MDFAPTSKDHLSGRYSFQRVVTFQQAAFGSFLVALREEGFEGTGNQKSYSYGVTTINVFSATS